MLLRLYKTILISFICGSLLFLDMSYKAGGLNITVNTVRAESLSTGGIKDQNLMSTLTMVGISVIASRLVLYGTITTDIALAAAGGLAFIAGDVAATNKLKAAKKKIEMEIERTKNGDLTDEQRQSLIRLLKMYEASKDSATTKKNLQMAAAAAFAAAAVAAYMASTAEIGLDASCTSASAAVTAAAQAGLSNPYTASIAGACLTAQGLAKTAQGTYTGGREVPAPSCPSITSVMPQWMGGVSTDKAAGAACTTFGGAAQMAACQAMFTGKKMNEPVSCVPPGILLATTAATVLMMGITASTLVTAIVGFCGPLAEMVDIAIYTPKRRAIVWGVLAGLAFGSASATGNVISQIDQEVKKIKGLLETINSQANGNLASNSIQSKTKNNVIVNKNGLLNVGNELGQESIAINGGKLPCITNNCSSFTSALENSAGFNSLPEGFKTDALNIGKMTDGLNGASSVTSGTLNSAANVGASALKIANELKKQKTDFQGRLLASGSKYNIDDEENKFKGQINSSYKDMLKKNKTSDQALLAAYGMGPSSSDLAKTTEEANKKIDKKFIGNFGKIIVPSFKLDSAVGSNAKNAVDLSTDNEAAKLKAEREALVKSDDIENYILETDITRDKTENIFEVISTRYKKSGYPRLLKRLNDKE